MRVLAGKRAIVVGASRGLGRGAAEALVRAGADVVGVARDATALAGTAAATGIRAEPGDATDPALAARLLAEHRPDLVVLAAGCLPPAGPLHKLGWDEFSANWHTDVKLTFEWLGAALRLPLSAGARTVVFSSGAALRGSPVSGGYAGAKATQRFITAYAQDEARRAGLALTFTAVLPTLTPATDLGGFAIRAYAARDGESAQAVAARVGDPLTPAHAGAAIVELATGEPGPAYLLTASGLAPLD
jgi:NAD(P)-dependent dehydrogenase (short-subunit alcohol dehydrogenase family)